jgi:prepilin-type N-terminal cleavage/methylation domain-containing protein
MTAFPTAPDPASPQPAQSRQEKSNVNIRVRHAMGFTLIELIVTIAIVTILAGVLVPAVGNYTEKSKKSKAVAEMRILTDAFTSYQTDTGAWPANTDLVTVATTNFPIVTMPCMFTNTFTKKGWDGPYLSKGTMNAGVMNVATAAAGAVPGSGVLDPWGNPYYCYTFATGYSGTTGAIVLLSRGKNGVANTPVANIFNNVPTSDDILQLVTYKP